MVSVMSCVIPHRLATLQLGCFYVLQVAVKMSGEFYMKFLKPKDADPDPKLLEAFNVS